MKKISDKNMVPNKCNKKQTANQESTKIDDDDDVYDIIEEVYRRENFDKEFDIGLISDCEYDEDVSKNKEESRGDNLE